MATKCILAPVVEIDAHGNEITVMKSTHVEMTPEELEAHISANEESLEDAKRFKIEAIRAEKKRIRDGGFVVDGILFCSDSEARISYLELSTDMATNPAMVVQAWKASDGVWVTMDGTLFSAVKEAWAGLLTSVFAWQAEKEAEVNEAQTKEALNDITVFYVG